jgi:hypothetical protein
MSSKVLPKALPKDPTCILIHRAGLYQVEVPPYGTVFLEKVDVRSWIAYTETGHLITAASTRGALEEKVFSGEY